MAKQKYTSAGTSINKNKLPRIYGILPKLYGLPLNQLGLTLDYGCGKYFHDYNLPGNIRGYDPFNLREEENLCNHYRNVLLSNVLNVIAEPEIRHEVLETAKSLGDVVYVTIYEGDKSGIGSETKEDCYQLNRRTREYRPELEAVFGAVEYKYGMFKCYTPDILGCPVSL